MTSTTPIALARVAVAATKEAVAAVVDPDAITPSAAVEQYEEYDRLARAAGAAKLVLAKRVDASGEARRRGLRTTAELLAKVGGTSLGSAQGELETSEALGQLPQTQRALLGGQVSPEQGRIVAGAAKANPDAERNLLIKAKTSNQRELLEEAQRVKAAADRDAEATHARIHRERRAGQFSDPEGAWNLRARGTVLDGSIISSELERLADEIFRDHGRSGTSESREAYQFDALRRMAERSRDLHLGGARSDDDEPGRRRQADPQHLALLRVDLEALWRGHVEDRRSRCALQNSEICARSMPRRTS